MLANLPYRIVRSSVGLAALIAISVVLPAQADVRLPRLISDGLVLQRDRPVKVWGWADEGEQVTVRLAGQSLTTKASHGRWQLTFKPLVAGPVGPIDIQGNNSLRISNVLAGDVWIAAGQSNMELPISRVLPRYPNLMKSTNLPEVREFSVPSDFSFKGPRADVRGGQWHSATSDFVGAFSAVGFFYARNLYQRYHVPIGIVSIAVGGSPAEAWISEQALAAYPDFQERYRKLADDDYLNQLISNDQQRVDAWYASARDTDIGLQQNPQWSSEFLPTSDWSPVTVPGRFADQHIDFVNGIVWLRRQVSLTEDQLQKVLTTTLLLGAVVDGDETFINGHPVGSTTYRYPPRRYTFPKDFLHAGVNSIAIRLTSYSSAAEFVPDKTYALQLDDQTISLTGPWQYRIGMRGNPWPQTTTLLYQPAGLFNAQLAPLFPMTMRGVIWYQGESNTDRAEQYRTLMPALIHEWRERFAQGNFPFLFVQLANFMQSSPEPQESNWALLRESQRQTLQVDHTGMAVAIDVGEWNDIHPLDKQSVGDRLALLARRLSYGEKNLICTGPMADHVTRKANKLLIHFQHTGSPLLIRGNTLTNIAVAGNDHQFHWAQARIVGDALLVWSDAVSAPESVRYAWADNPAGANLYNRAGLPASPFQMTLTR